MRRSTVLNLHLYTLKKVLFKYYRTIEPNASDDEIRTIVEDSIVEEGTPEGIVDHTNATKLDAYHIASPEFGSVFQRMRPDQYEFGYAASLSKLYYGEGGTQLLSQRKGGIGVRRLREGLYVTMFATMQEPRYYLTPELMRQGLLRRIILCYVKPEELKDWNHLSTNLRKVKLSSES